ncbi:MAG: WYL domain-containing protein [Anaerovoracaceae bacterium]
MAKEYNQKLKLLYLMKMFLENTDEDCGITMEQIVKTLAVNGVKAERKSIYDDIKQLQEFGLDIVGRSMGKNYEYFLASRTFEIAELKLLVDAVQSSKFITAKKSNQLIKKIESLASHNQAKQLQRQVFVSQRIKTMNESIYYNVDKIHSAINGNHTIEFQYFKWTVDKKMELKHGGDYYKLSPWALSWDDENYYLVAFDSEEEKIKHFRVDKMKNIKVTDQPRMGKEVLKGFDAALYAKKVFGMYGGDDEQVRMEFENQLIGVVIDRFGKNVIIAKTDDQHFMVTVTVVVSNQFFGWVMGIGKGVKIIGPEWVVEKMCDEVKRLSEIYDCPI